MNLVRAHKSSASRGFTIVEIAIVLAVVGVILSGIWAMAVSMSNSARQGDFTALMTRIIGNVRGHFAGRPTFVANFQTMTNELKSMNAFPGQLVRPGVTEIDSPYGASTLRVCGWNYAGTQTSCGNSIENITLFAVEAVFRRPQDCIRAAVANGGPLVHPGLVAVYINASPIPQLPVRISDASTAARCLAAANNNPINVSFVFLLRP